MKFQEFHYWVRHAKCTWSSYEFSRKQEANSGGEVSTYQTRPIKHLLKFLHKPQANSSGEGSTYQTRPMASFLGFLPQSRGQFWRRGLTYETRPMASFLGFLPQSKGLILEEKVKSMKLDPFCLFHGFYAQSRG